MGKTLRGLNPHMGSGPSQRKAPSKRSRKRAAYTKARNPYAADKRTQAERRRIEAEAGARAQQAQQSASQALMEQSFDPAAIEACDDPQGARHNALLSYSLANGLKVQIQILGEQRQVKIKGFGHYGLLKAELDHAGVAANKRWWLWALMKMAEPATDEIATVDAWTTPEQANALAQSLSHKVTPN